ncbi:MAG: hypothetical protein ACRDQA_04190 [Nocardioidaceae bacterium]
MGRDPSFLGTPTEVADRMLATMPVAHPWDAQIGPFYDTPTVARLLNVTKQAIADRVRRRTLLAATTRQGKIVYPTWQFEGRRVLPEVSQAVAAFRDVPVDGWAIGSWFTTPVELLDGATPAQWLGKHRALDPVHALAKETANRWAR